MTSAFKYVLWIFGGIFLFLLALTAVWPELSKIMSGRVPPDQEAPNMYVTAQLEKSIGFDTVVSYSDNGFEPKEVTINQGQTVRFANNSSGDLWVVSVGTGDHLYPGRSDCSETEFDSCSTILPGEFWEFTFDVEGSGTYQNSLEPEKTGFIIVKQQL